jgi:hypothetical protein
VQTIDAAYGHLCPGREDEDRDLLDLYDGHNGGGGHALGTSADEGDVCDEPR